MVSTTADRYEDKIREVEPRHKDLLATINETADAASAHSEQERYISKLQGAISMPPIRRLSSLEKKLQKELKEYESYRDSAIAPLGI